MSKQIDISHLTPEQIAEIKNVYYNPKTGLSIAKAYNVLKDKYSKNDIAGVVRKQNVNQIQEKIDYDDIKKQYKKVLPRPGWYQTDLWIPERASVIARLNKGYQYVLTIISLASRYLYTYPLKNKDGKTVSEAFTQFFKDQANTPEHEYEKPVNMSSDKGKEYQSKHVKSVLHEHGCEQYLLDKKNTHSTGAMNVIERVNQTLKNQLDNYMIANDTNNWIDGLKDITDGYNQSIHSYLKQSPESVEFDDALENYIRDKKFNEKQHALYDLKVGDIVRMIHKKKALINKGKTYSYKNKIYKITRIEGNKYYIQDINKNTEKKKAVPIYYLRKVTDVEYKDNKIDSNNEKEIVDRELANRKQKRLLKKEGLTD